MLPLLFSNIEIAYCKLLDQLLHKKRQEEILYEVHRKEMRSKEMKGNWELPWEKSLEIRKNTHKREIDE